MKIRKGLTDLIYTIFANFITVALGVVTGFLLPRFLGVEEYGYYKVFTFYLTYKGFMHFGFLDGIYLKYGSYNYEELPKKKFRMFYRFFTILEISIMLIAILAINIMKVEPVRNTIYILIFVNIVLMNTIVYFDLINQFTKRFKIYSLTLISNKVLFVIGVLVLFSLGYNYHLYYILLQTTVNIVIVLVYIYYDKAIIFGEADKMINNIKELKNNFYVGFFVLIGNFMNVIILGLDRLFIDRFFDLSVFAMYSFAFSLVSLFFIIINSLASVLYPYLARSDKTNMDNTYKIIKMFLIVTVSYIMSGYFILKIIIIKFLPDYTDAIIISTILMATILFSSQNSIIISNFYKVLKLQKDFTKNNIIAFFMGLITNIIAYVLFKSEVAIAVASLVTFIMWLGYSDYYFSKKIKLEIFKYKIIELLIICVFSMCALLLNWIFGMISYLLIITLILFLSCKIDVLLVYKYLKNKNKNI